MAVTAAGLLVEQADGLPDVGHRLPADVLGVPQRVDRVVDVTAVLEVAAGSGQVQQGDAEGVRDDVMHLARDPLPLLERSLRDPLLLLEPGVVEPALLGLHDPADVPPGQDHGDGDAVEVPDADRQRAREHRAEDDAATAHRLQRAEPSDDEGRASVIFTYA